MPTIIKIFASTTYQDLEDKMNNFIQHTPGYLISIRYSTTASETAFHCSALIRFEASA